MGSEDPGEDPMRLTEQAREGSQAEEGQAEQVTVGAFDPDAGAAEASGPEGPERPEEAETSSPMDINVDAEAPVTGREGPTLEEEHDTGESTAEGQSSRRDEEVQMRDRALAEFLGMMDEYTPVIPDLVIDYYLNKAGFDCDDVRTKRLLALAAQKFVSDVATDAYQHCKVRQQGTKKGTTKEKKTLLTMADLSAALSEHGMNVKKPLFYAG